MSSRTTGGWVVRREDTHGTAWLIGGPFDPDSIRSWLSWSGNAADAYVFPTKKAVRAAMRGHGRRYTVERSVGHEEAER